ncbi:hypothetical protein GCM10022267_57440 [Lentzea roselyniae]|uniref:GGDEF domain-containing protein n=1 Tax=Lentzea roselyniae TaxID=531940 RepID=A0ABP7BLT1_9PSEU
MAARMASVLHLEAIAGRLGGDEFVILVPGADVEDTMCLAKSVLNELNGAPEQLGASIGAAVSGSGADTADLLRDADTAIYVAERTASRVLGRLTSLSA